MLKVDNCPLEIDNPLMEVDIYSVKIDICLVEVYIYPVKINICPRRINRRIIRCYGKNRDDAKKPVKFGKKGVLHVFNAGNSAALFNSDSLKFKSIATPFFCLI